MNMDYLVNLIQDLIRQEMETKNWFSIGTVTAYDNLTHTARVQLQYEQVETDFIRIGVGYSGNNFGEKKPLEIGTEVVVGFYNGDLTSGIILNSIYTDPSDMPPGIVGNGDWGIHHKIGSSLLIKSNGDITATNPGGQKIELKNDGSITFTGVAGKFLTLDNTGKLTTNTGSLATTQAAVLKAFLDFFDQHTHLGNLGYPTGTPIIPAATVPNLTTDGA